MDVLIEEFLDNFERFLEDKPESEYPGYGKQENKISKGHKSKFNDATLD